MAKKYYDENDNEVKVKQKRGGCLKWLLYGFIVIVVLGACGAILDDGEEEEQIPEETVEKEKDSSEEKEEKSEPVEEESEDTKEDTETEAKTIEDIANLNLNNVTSTDEYDGELTITFEPRFTSNDERMLIILTEQISRFLLDAKENAENLDDYDSIVVMAKDRKSVV